MIRTIAYAHPVYTPRAWRAGAPRRDQRPQPHALLRRVLGLGLPRGRRRRARCASPSALGERARRDGQRALRRGRSATAASPCASTSSTTGSRWPTSTSTSCPACSAAAVRAGASCASAARDYLGDPARRCRRGAAPVAERTGIAPTARSGCSRSCARSATASTRSASTTASTPPASAGGDRRRGHQHALGRAPRVRAAGGGDGPVCTARRPRRCTSRRSWAWTALRRGAPPSPATTLSVHIASGGEPRSTRRSRCAAGR